MIRSFILAIIFCLVAGCAQTSTTNEVAPAMIARAIAVIPPLNHSVEIDAPYVLLSMVSEPLAERGYYVYPVAVVEKLFRENGMATTGDMNQIPLVKIREHIGADAALYMTINNWGQKFQLIQSVAVVDVDFSLVSTLSGEVLWESSVDVTSADDFEEDRDFGDMIIAAVLDQVSGSLSDQSEQLARNHVPQTLRQDLPAGPYRLDPARTSQ